MRYTLFLLLLISIYSHGQMPALIAATSNRSGVPTLAHPSVINARPVSTSSIFVYFTAASLADSYVVERSVNSDFSASTDLSINGYNGTDLTFTDTGLSTNTVYYYRVKSVSSGFADSQFVTTSTTTHAATPVGWYSVEGGQKSTNNSYLEWTGNLVSTIKNHGGGAGPDFPASTGNLTFDTFTNRRAAVSGRVGSSAYTAASDLTLTGDFCIAMYFEPEPGSATSPIMSETTSNSAYAWINTTKAFLQTRINGTNYDMAFTSSLEANKLHKIVWKRVGNKASASRDGGYTYGTEYTVNTGDLKIDRFFATDVNGSRNMVNWVMFAFFDEVLTGAQLDPFFEPYKMSPYSIEEETSTIPEFTGTWTALTNGSPLVSGISVNDNGSFSWRRVWSKGNYSYIKSTKDATTFYSEQLLTIFNHINGKVSPAITLPAYTNGTDIHNQSSILLFDNTVFQIGHDRDYGANSNTFRLREFGHGYDLRLYTEKVIGGNVTNQLAQSNQYLQATSIGDTVVTLMQKFTTYADGLKIMYSTDRMNFWEIVQPVTTTAGTWVYPYLLNNGTLDTFYFILIENTAATAKYPSISLLKTTDFLTFSNLQNTYSFTYNQASLVNLTTIISNAAMRTTTADVQKNVPPGNFYIDANEFVYGVHGNGENTAWEVTYYNAGWQHVDISFPAAQAVVLPPAGAGTNFNRVSPIIFKDDTDVTNNTYTVYALCDPASNGLYRVGKFTTDDLFATEVTFVEYVSTDNTRKHWNLQPDFNYHFNTRAVLVGTQVDGSNAYEWIYQVK